jgi:hypothetical protein
MPFESFVHVAICVIGYVALVSSLEAIGAVVCASPGVVNAIQRLRWVFEIESTPVAAREVSSAADHVFCSDVALFNVLAWLDQADRTSI